MIAVLPQQQSPSVTPPTTFSECSIKAAAAVRRAIKDGDQLLEVEFPPLPPQYLEDSSSSAEELARANTKWAITFAQCLSDLGHAYVIYPDQAELDTASKYANCSSSGGHFAANVSLACVRADSFRNAGSLDQLVASILGASFGGVVQAIPDAALYVAVVSSTQELTDLEKLHKLSPQTPIVFFNLRLDQLVSSSALIFTTSPLVLKLIYILHHLRVVTDLNATRGETWACRSSPLGISTIASCPA
jgi:hypothetical protein